MHYAVPSEDTTIFVHCLWQPFQYQSNYDCTDVIIFGIYYGIIPPWATKQQMDVLEIPHESWKVYCNSHVTQEWGKSWCTCKLHVPCVMNWEFFLLKIPKMIGSTFLLKKWHFRLFYLSIRRSSKVFNVVQNLTTVG